MVFAGRRTPQGLTALHMLCVPTESTLTARRCLLQHGLKPRACRTLHIVWVPTALPSSPLSVAEFFYKGYPGTSIGAAGFLLSSSTPLLIPFQEALADVIIFYIRPGQVHSPEDISLPLLLVLITALLTSRVDFVFPYLLSVLCVLM